MHDLKLGEKGQVTLPKIIRDRYNLTKGAEMRMVDLGNGIVEVVLLKHSRDLPPPVVKTRRKVSDSDIKKSTRQAAQSRYKRSVQK